VTELRTAVNALRGAAGLGAASFTDASLPGIPIKALHITQLRAALDAARIALGLPAITYADSALTAGVTPVKAVHLQQLRNGIE